MNADFLKVVIVAVALLFFLIKLAPKLTPLNRNLICIGLFLLLFAGILDFTDNIVAFNEVAILGRLDPYHDLLEDQLGDSLGLILVFFGSFRELLRKKQ